MTHEWQPSNSVNKLLMWTSDSSFLYTWLFLINKPTCPINQCQIFFFSFHVTLTHTSPAQSIGLLLPHPTPGDPLFFPSPLLSRTTGKPQPPQPSESTSPGIEALGDRRGWSGNLQLPPVDSRDLPTHWLEKRSTS